LFLLCCSFFFLFFQDLELHYPRLRLIEAGFKVQVVGPKKGTYKSKFGYWANADSIFTDINAENVSVLIIPGGWCPDRLRRLVFLCCFVLLSFCVLQVSRVREPRG
jgi:putative intracellular protease/amidase